MTDPQDKWVWGDESDASPLGAPLLDRKLEPIVDWFQIAPDPPVATQAPVEAPLEETIKPQEILQSPVTNIGEAAPVAEIASQPAVPGASAASDLNSASLNPASVLAPPVSEEAPPPATAAPDLSSSVVKATMLHLDGQVEAAIEELRAGLAQGEQQVELYAAMGALQMELERFEDAAVSYREVLKRDSRNDTATHNLAECEERIKELKKPPKAPTEPGQGDHAAHGGEARRGDSRIAARSESRRENC